MSATRDQAIGLIDGNSFYCSCERLFRPDLKHTPIVTLSNNDGNIVALTPEAKALGFKMGTPYFQVRDDLERLGVAVFSSNYALYGDISERMMTTIESMADRTETYSIDEMFVDLTGFPEPLADHGRAIRDRVLQWVGIPVGVGIGPTKTLAKLANRAAKKWLRQTGGVVDLRDPARQRKLLALVDVDDIWGIGSGLKQRLHDIGIRTGLQLVSHDIVALRRVGGVVLERTVRELRGISCIPLEDAPAPRQMICKGQSFGQRIRTQPPLREAVASYITRAAEKLRAQGSLCGALRIAIRTGMFNPNEPRYAKSLVIPLPYPTDDTRDLLAAGQAAVKHLFRPGYAYAKAEVLLMDLRIPGEHTLDLFAPQPRANAQPLMAVMDAINRRMGPGSVRPAAVPQAAQWKMAREMMSPRYTTDLNQLWRVFAK